MVGLPIGMSDSTSLSATLEFDNIGSEVKSALANLAAVTVVSKNYSGCKLDVESLLEEWANLLSCSRLVVM